MTGPEFTRPIDVRQAQGLCPKLEADEAERAALARRFGLVRIDRLEAALELTRKDRVVEASGTLSAAFIQPCAVSGDDVAVSVNEPVAFRFVPEGDHATPDEEVELAADELDEIEYAGTQFDLGEAVAQSLALAIDPYLAGPNAEKARARAGLLGEENSGPFAALKGLGIGKDS